MPSDSRTPAGTPESESRGVRLDSWKEIAAYLKRHVTTVRRWEKQEGLPVHRHLHARLGSVYAYSKELDSWFHTRRPTSDLVPEQSMSIDLPRELIHPPLPPVLAALGSSPVGLLGRDTDLQALDLRGVQLAGASHSSSL
jgi:hypothetical protein